MEEVLHGDEEMEMRRGPWTVEEDLILVNYIANHGDGRWNSLARHAGLKRTGKSCRLRWLNYLRPDVRRGNITPEEQLLILELHSRWGNRWSKIAQHLPGRTDNEIKNYWRTRVQKHAKQLQCDVNSKQFKDVMKYLWMPRLIERIRAASGVSPATGSVYQSSTNYHDETTKEIILETSKPSPESSSFAGSSSDPPLSDVPEEDIDNSNGGLGGCWPEQCLLSPGGYMEFDQGWTSWGNNTTGGTDHLSDSLWNVGDSWLIDH